MRARLSRWTNLDPDFAILDVEEAWTLHDLIVKASASDDPHIDAFNPDLLPKRDRGRLEKLVERASGQVGAFQTSREMAELRQEVAEIARETMKPERRIKFEEEGSVTLPRKWCYEFIADGILWVEHLSVLVALLSFFENAEVPPRVYGARFERDGDDLVLVVDSLMFSFDGISEDGLPTWPRLLDHLVTNAFFEVEKHGKEWTIRLGSRTRAVGEGRRSK